MRRCLSLVLTFILLFTAAVPTVAETVDNSAAEAVLYDGTHLVKADPALIGETYAVREGTRSIAANAFRDCTQLKDVYLPDTVYMIGENAFDNTALYNDPNRWQDGLLIVSAQFLVKANAALETCHIPSSVSVIADGAFEHCTALKHLFVPPTVKRLTSDTFRGVTYNTEVYYDGSLSDFSLSGDLHPSDLNLITVETKTLLRIIFIIAALSALYVIAVVIRNWHKKLLLQAEDEEESEQ